MLKTQRIRDPIHDIIVFSEDEPLDMAVFDLLATPDVQRLRRIKQLGVSEFVYPAATHSRLAHSIGVFNNARRLLHLIRREIELGRVPGEYNHERAKVAVFAAMLHDIGHGPFSHAFEEARKSIGSSGKIKKHEAFTADMIADPSGAIGDILARLNVEPAEVAQLIRAETPEDMYHAIISSSFDADRLDYLMRDRHGTGVGGGSIDLEWLMDNVRVAEIDFSPAEESIDGAVFRHSFCLTHKARDAAEDFLLARYRLYTNVYFHKTTRGIEQMISAFFREASCEIEARGRVQGLVDDHPLVRFFSAGGETLDHYRALDDSVVWGAIHETARAGFGDAQRLAQRILTREKPVALDVQLTFPGDSERQRRLKHQLDRKFKGVMGKSVFRDTAKLSIYGEIGADDGRAQKRLMIQLPSGDLKEITDFPDVAIAGSEKERLFDRYFFLTESDYSSAKTVVDSVRGRQG